MVWQDVVISICGWAATFALVPSLIGKDKPALWSSVFTTIIVATFAFCYASLGLWTAAASTSVLSLAWLVLAIQKWHQNRMLK